MKRLLALALSTCLASPASAQLLTLGVGNATSGSVAFSLSSAVTFNPLTSIRVSGASLGANATNVATGAGAMIVWLRGGVSNSTIGAGIDNNYYAGLVDFVANTGGTNAGTPQFFGSWGNSEFENGFVFVTDQAGGYGTVRMNLNDNFCAAYQCANPNTSHAYLGTSNANWVNAHWDQYAFFWCMNKATGTKLSAYYKNGAKVAWSSALEQGTVAAFAPDINNASQGFGINVGNVTGTTGSFDAQQLLFTALPSCPLDGSANLTLIPTTNFYNAGPVDFGANGSNVFGFQPDVFYVGDKTAWTTNLGAATGALTVANMISGSSVTPALYGSWGPSGPPTDKPYVNWAFQGKVTIPAGTLDVVTNYPAMTGGANPIAVGDLLLIAIQITDTALNYDRTLATASTGWAIVPTTGITLPYHSVAAFPSNYALFYHIATAGDITAAGANWTTVPTVTYKANPTAARSSSYVVMNYGGANASTPIQTAVGSYNAASATPAYPAATPTSTPATLVSIMMLPNNGGQSYPPTGEDLRMRRTDAAGGSQTAITVSDTPIASGNVASRNGSLTGTTYATVTLSVVLGK